MTLEEVSGWGRFPRLAARVEHVRFHRDLHRRTEEAKPLLARGSGRSYGDACIFENLVSTIHLNHLLEFDQTTGVLRVEAGVTLEKILCFAVPRGWFLPVTPGTKFPTLGGCIAADVHGKNHHVDGSIARFVRELDMVLADGRGVRCSAEENGDLFDATIGGMGLTGFVYAATLQLRQISSAYISMRSIKTACFAETCDVLTDTAGQYTYSVAWVDCLADGKRLGRGIVHLGNHALLGTEPQGDGFALHHPQRLSVPFSLPQFVLNGRNVRVFNKLYYHKHGSNLNEQLIHYDPFFYPLDSVRDWNRVYGRNGFVQYQFVVPSAGGRRLMEKILGKIASQGSASFLAVLKTFGPGRGLLSFPIEGYTLALDFPLRSESTIPFLHHLDDEISAAGGRVYLAKDAVLQRNNFAAMYPEIDDFRAIKAKYDPSNLFRSTQSERLGIS
jgi:decaprenylphospho-beta-D-ribofuranose 2-oxidase